jgi:serine/threonine-protein kinase
MMRIANADTEPSSVFDAPRRSRSPSLIEPPGYDIRERLGSGGMGEVVLARDTDIGRDVAIKSLSIANADDAMHARFLREARIQALLDHPAIVPVYEIGRDPHGRPYFTMKRISGQTLGDALVRDDASLQRLLRVLVEVCVAIDLAHTRGVVHRDLKPANIMLGDFGEVYVLDWGIARVIGDSDIARDENIQLPGNTQGGSLLGTPGYAAPEQMRGDHDVGPAADIYALGAILYEILTRKPLHPRPVLFAIASSQAIPMATPSPSPTRIPAVAPELEAICNSALAADPSARPSARELGNAIQRYLDGDRDVARRRALAAEHLAVAREALASGDYERRGEAMRAAGCALALDPESEAAALVGRLMLEVDPRAKLPPQLAAQVGDMERKIAVRGARSFAWTMSAYFAFIPLVLWVGVEQPLVIAGFFGYIALQVGYHVWAARTRRAPSLVVYAANIVLVLLLSRLFAPIIVVPAIIVAFSIVSTRHTSLFDQPWLTITFAIFTFLLPLALEFAGVFAPTWTVLDESLVVHGAATVLGGTRGVVYLIAVHVALIAVATRFAWSLARQRRDAQRRLEIQAWQLRQLLPGCPKQQVNFGITPACEAARHSAESTV